MDAVKVGQHKYNRLSHTESRPMVARGQKDFCPAVTNCLLFSLILSSFPHFTLAPALFAILPTCRTLADLVLTPLLAER
jgi:hypothetical protein